VNAFLKLFPLAAALAIVSCNAGGSPNTPTGGGPSQSGPSTTAHFVPEWQARSPARLQSARGRRTMPGIGCFEACKFKLFAVQRKLRLAPHRLADAL
jgi:hypothetical protein